jgi:hypothetical protein
MSRGFRSLVFCLFVAGFCGENAYAQNVFKPITSTTPYKLVDSTGKLLGPLIDGRLAGDDNKDAFSIRVNVAGFMENQVTFFYEASNCSGTPYLRPPWELLPYIAGVVGLGTRDDEFGSYPGARIYYPAPPYTKVKVNSYNFSNDTTCNQSGPDDMVAGVAKYVTATGFTPPFFAKSQ